MRLEERAGGRRTAGSVAANAGMRFRVVDPAGEASVRAGAPVAQW